MSVPKNAGPLAAAIARFLAHKRALGHGAQLEGWLLPKLLQHVQQSGCPDLTAQCFERWLTSLNQAAQVRDEQGRRPRIHDLRHHSECRIIPSSE